MSTRLSDNIPYWYLNPGTIGTYHHTRLLKTIVPLIKIFPKASWITFGDHSNEAVFLERQGIDVVASNLTEAPLRLAHERGYIKKFREENAEDISLPDNSYDFCLCKETYHHFCRPSIALYEMLRVARIGVVLIEPLDETGPLRFARTMAKRGFRGKRTHAFEDLGNFVYRINIREIEKMLTALNGFCMAIKKLNVFSHGPFDFKMVRPFSTAYLVTKLAIFLQNILSFSRLMSYGIGTIILFQNPVQPSACKILRAEGFRVKLLPKNPYLESE